MNRKLAKFIDSEMSQKFLDSFYDAVGMAAAIADLQGNVLIGSRRQRICEEFHSVHEETCTECSAEADMELARFLGGNGLSLSRCSNGLANMTSPIVIEGEHIANVIIEHFLLSPPDAETFGNEARQCGFDKTAYLEALSHVPIVTKERLPSIVTLLTFMAEMGLRQLGQIEAERELRTSLDHMKRLVQERTAKLEKVSQELQLGEEYFRRTFDQGPIGAAIVALDLRYQRVNAAFCRMIGYSPEELLGRMFPEITHSDDIEGNLENARQLLSGEADQYDVEKRYIRKNGEIVWANLHVRIIRDGSGKPLYFVSMMEDITERKRTEEAIRRDIVRRKEAEAELKLYMKELEKSNRALREFTSIASHDLQEPLRKIKLFGDLVKKTFDRFMPPEARDYIDRIQTASNRMQDLIESLLAYSRLTTRAETFSLADLKQIIQDVLSDLEARIEKEKGSVTVLDLPFIETDPNQMRQLFQNLISNALKYHGQRSPQVKVYGEVLENGTCRIFVEDNGIGFDEENLETIFAPFQRLHGREKYEGTGMGLAICRKIVERHGGSITAKSRPGEGSTFIVTLPIRHKGSWDNLSDSSSA